MNRYPVMVVLACFALGCANATMQEDAVVTPSAASRAAAPAQASPASQQPPATEAVAPAGAMQKLPAPSVEPSPPGAPAPAPPAAEPAPPIPPASSEPLGVKVEPDRAGMYERAENWLCLPGTDDGLCTTGLDATIVRADGATELEPHVVAEDPAFDCFYVYPTVSNDSGANSDLRAGNEETNVVRGQAARYSRVCRVFAPLYRQVTLNSLTSGTISDDARTHAYRDVVAAFDHYLRKYNAGRGFVLVGHSQGSGMLKRLLAAEFDPRPEIRARLIAAHLIGTQLAVPEGQVVGAELKAVPLCRSETETGCVVNYSTFRAGSPPPEGSRYGRAMGGRAACVQPAAPGGGPAFLTPYFERTQPAFAQGGGRITTPFVTFPDFLEAECVDRGELTYLELTVHSDPGDPRVDDINGDLTPEWGLHLVDVHIAMGSLVELAAKQAEAYRSVMP